MTSARAVLGRVTLPVLMMLAAGCSRTGDWSASRDAYCRGLETTRSDVEGRLGSLVADLRGLDGRLDAGAPPSEDRGARWKRRIEQCTRVRWEIRELAALLHGFRAGSAAVHAGHGAKSLAELGLTTPTFAADELRAYKMDLCEARQDAKASAELAAIETKVLDDFKAAEVACQAAGVK